MADWVPPKQWIRWEEELGATPAAAKMARDLVKVGGQNLRNLGQGAERPNMPNVIKSLFTSQSSPAAAYHTDAMGPEKTRESVARFDRIFLNIRTADPSNTFVIRQQGRFALKAAYETVKLLYKGGGNPIAVMPNLRWPMTDNLMKPYGFDVVTYDIAAADGVLASIRHAVESADAKRIAVIYFGSPGNPTGLHMGPLYPDIINYIDYLNSEHGPDESKITTIHDDPYFASLEFADPDDAENCTMKGGYGALTLTTETPKIVLHSWSKAGETASMGLTSGFIVDQDGKVHDTFRNALNNGGALGYDDALMEQFAGLLGGGHDKDLRAHFRATHIKYASDREILQAAFPGKVVQGGVSMTSLMSFLPEHMLGKAVRCHDGATRHMGKPVAVHEYMANEHGVITVPNGRIEKNIYVRVAQADQPADFSDGAERLKNAMNAVDPSLA